MSCITLLSDLGLHDASVAVAKGILMQHSDLPVFDISHEVRQYYMPQAAYILGTAWKRFPPGSIHVPLFDLFATGSSPLVLFSHEGHYFLAPDNGIVTMALGTVPRAWLCHRPDKGDGYAQWLHQIAIAIRQLTEVPAALAEFTAYEPTRTPMLPEPRGDASGISCEVIHIDHYENVITNMTRTRFRELGGSRPFRLQYMLIEEIDEISADYSDVRDGYKLCRFNSHDHLEICVNHGKAASLFGFSLGSPFNDIKLIFE